MFSIHLHFGPRFPQRGYPIKPTHNQKKRHEEEEEEEGLYLRIETRKRVQTNEAKSKRRRASPT